MHYACWNQWMLRNPTCPLCRRPQSLDDTLTRQMAGLSVVYDIIDYENGPSQVIGELGPSPGRLARNSRAQVTQNSRAQANPNSRARVAQQVLANVDTTIVQQQNRTTTRDGGVWRVSRPDSGDQ